jgi:hypothetical protein
MEMDTFKMKIFIHLKKQIITIISLIEKQTWEFHYHKNIKEYKIQRDLFFCKNIWLYNIYFLYVRISDFFKSNNFL